MRDPLRFIGFILIMNIVLAPLPAFTQDDIYSSKHRQHLSLGISAGQLSDNAWIGVEVTHSVIYPRISLRLTGSIHWLEAYKVQFDRWGTFSVISPTVVVYSNIAETSRWYIDFGPMFIIPQNKVSEKKLISGVSTLVGLEVFLFKTSDRGLCYYFGIGLNYANAYADKLENDPRYSDGFTFNNGFRFYF